MKCKYSFPVRARITLPFPMSFQQADRTYSLELENGRLKAISVMVENIPDSSLPQVTETPQVSIRFPFDPQLAFLLPDIRALEGALALWGVQRIETVRFKTEWIPESEADKAKLKIFAFERNREEEGQSYPAPAIDLLLRTIVSVDRFRDWEVPLNFNRRGRQAVIQERYIEAIYEFYFFTESLFGNGKFKTNAVTQEFIASTQLNAAIARALADPDSEFISDAGLNAEFQKHYRGKTHDQIIRRFVELRGFLHHHSIKNRQAWNPGLQLQYKADALFWESVSNVAAMNYSTDILFDPAEIQKFKATTIRKPNGIVRFNMDGAQAP